MTTPDVHTDLISKMTALAASSFPSGTLYSFAELPTGGPTLEGSTSVKFTGETIPEVYDQNGTVRVLTFQVKRRFDPTQDAKGALAFAAMMAFYDAIHGAGGIGNFTVNAHAYIDLQAKSAPRLREQNYIMMDVDLTLDQVSV